MVKKRTGTSSGGSISPEEKGLREALDVYDLSKKNFRDVLDRLLGSNQNSYEVPRTTSSFPTRSTRFLVVGDLHLNARGEDGKYGCDFKRFKKVVHMAKEEGAEFIIQTGDVTDGENMRHHQKYGLVTQGLDNVVEFCANGWPQSDLSTYFIGGNHDETYLNFIGADICKYIADRRPDLHYLGMNEGNLPLQPKFQKMLLQGKSIPVKGPTWIRIRHPSKGSAKGRSYQPQQHVEALEGSFKPHILIIGHYHKMDYLFKRNVHIIQAGTMEFQSGWMRTKDLAAHLGAILVDAYHTEDGTLTYLEHRRLEYTVNGRENFGILRKGV